MDKFSIVMVVKDSADNTGRLLKSAEGSTDDVIVCDMGSNDDTIQNYKRCGSIGLQHPMGGLWQASG